jgi:cell shape-determining protein MreC
MLIRICLIVAIVAGLAVGVLNFLQVRTKITTLQQNLASETAARQTAEKERDDTKTELANTQTELKNTKATLETTTQERDKAVADATSATKRADKLSEELTKTRQERDDAQAELAAFNATGLKPEQIVAINRQFKGLQEELAGAQSENKVLGQRIERLKNELAIYKTPEYVVPLRADLRGKITQADPKWNFVVLNIGEQDGVLEHGELLVNRGGKLVAKVRVRTVRKDHCIANVLPGWQIGEVVEGDVVIPAHPAS